MACKATFERWEEDLAVLVDGESGQVLPIERSLLPEGAAPGDTLTLVEGVWQPCPEETAVRARRIAQKAARLLRRSPGTSGGSHG